MEPRKSSAPSKEPPEMKPLTLVAGAAALACAAAPAFAGPAFDAFRKVCGDSHGDFAAIKAAAEGGGWTPTEVAPSTMEGVTVTESLARQTAAGGTKLTLFAWQGSKGAVQVSGCTVRAAQSKLGGLAA